MKIICNNKLGYCNICGNEVIIDDLLYKSKSIGITELKVCKKCKLTPYKDLVYKNK